jgi:hypothetical protein
MTTVAERAAEKIESLMLLASHNRDARLSFKQDAAAIIAAEVEADDRLAQAIEKVREMAKRVVAESLKQNSNDIWQRAKGAELAMELLESLATAPAPEHEHDWYNDGNIVRCYHCTYIKYPAAASPTYSRQRRVSKMSEKAVSFSCNHKGGGDFGPPFPNCPICQANADLVAASPSPHSSARLEPWYDRLHDYCTRNNLMDADEEFVRDLIRTELDRATPSEDAQAIATRFIGSGDNVTDRRERCAFAIQGLVDCEVDRAEARVKELREWQFNVEECESTVCSLKPAAK